MKIKFCFFQVDTDKELAVISVLPQDPPESWSVETRHDFVYLVTTTCNIVFFSEIYSTVYCLDMSPSISAVVNSFNVKQTINHFLTSVRLVNIVYFITRSRSLAFFHSQRLRQQPKCPLLRASIAYQVHDYSR